MLIFDIESNGLLDTIHTIHCVVIWDSETNLTKRYNHKKNNIEEAVRILNEADCICGANIIGYDIPAINAVYPWFNPRGRIVDTLVVTRFVYPDMKDRDFQALKARRAKGKEWIPGKLYGRHSLEAWGHRLGEHKGDYKYDFMAQAGDSYVSGDEWREWSLAMENYCEQDVVVTRKLWDKVRPLIPEGDVMDLEHAVQTIIQRQVRFGFQFDTPGAAKLYAKLSGRREAIKDQLADVFGAWYEFKGTMEPKVNNGPNGYTKGVPLSKVKLVQFNAASRDHIANRLIKLYGWKPTVKTDKGKVKVDEAVLSGLMYPHVELITEYLMLDKRIGQIAEGKQAWLKLEKNGRIYGSVNTNGAVTGRMTHSHPNVAQVPSGRSEYGPECRALFGVPRGYKLVGCDADGLELRVLAHYMASRDGGKYANAVVKGDKATGTDAHTLNMKAVGLLSRDTAKTWLYAFIYGAGDAKLGSVMCEDLPLNKSEFVMGRNSRRNFETKVPALGDLVKRVKASVKKKGYLIGIDGRHLSSRSEHSALNTLLQSAGAVIMKRALVILDNSLIAAGLIPGTDYEFVANVHDEFQIQTKEEHVSTVKTLAGNSIREAGEFYRFRCELAGSADAGDNWAETH